MAAASPVTLTPLELATSTPLGGHQVALPTTTKDPRGALECAVRTALMHPPCLVSFSGGRDSSAVLAVAAQVARAEGHALPVPVTMRYPQLPLTKESQWQELVVRHLGLRDWIVLEFTNELELAGDIAMSTLRRHGLLWPPNAYLHQPLLSRARGGSLLTGFDGDTLFNEWRWARAQQVLAGRVAPSLRDVPRVAYALAPRPVRRAVARRRMRDLGHRWLRPGARSIAARTIAADAASEPRRWDRRLSWLAGRRYLALAVQSLGELANEHDAAIHHPLLDLEFLAALARRHPAAGFADRTAAMRELFADVLPEPVLTRLHKAAFDEALWRERTRDFARAWKGQGVDSTVVDVDALRAEWLSPSPHFDSFTMLQSALLHSA